VFAEGDATGGSPGGPGDGGPEIGGVLVAALGVALATKDGERSPIGPIRTPAVAAEPLMKASSATTIIAIVACLLLIPLSLPQTTSGELRCGVGG
jgi:hypothetical protein